MPRPSIVVLALLASTAWTASTVACVRERDEARRLPEIESRDAGADACAGTFCQGACVDPRTSPENCGGCGHACPSGMGCAESICTTASGWHASARQAIGDPVACVPRARFAVRCPAGHEPGGSVWGSDVYTDDSSVCQAAVHAGVITASTGGDVAIEVRAGQSGYRGVLRNGVESSAFGTWRCSFVMGSSHCAAGSTRCGTTCTDVRVDTTHCGACGHACGVDESCRAGTCMPGLDADWTTNATRWPCKTGVTHVVHCLPLGSAVPLGTVYGSGPYTDDSSICAAAVHAGKLTTKGGDVTIELRPGRSKYLGSTAHGVTTTPWGAWGCSYVIR